jgi:hypothetical protein
MKHHITQMMRSPTKQHHEGISGALAQGAVGPLMQDIDHLVVS